METILKFCKRCGQTKPATTEYFTRDAYGKYGFRSLCKACTKSGKEKPIKPIPLTDKYRNADIYRTYYRSACDNPVKRKMLANFYGIPVTELKNIIKTEDEKQMHKKWTDQMNEELLALANAGSSKEELSASYGCSIANIIWRVSMLRKAAKEAKTVIETAEPVIETPTIPDDPLPGTPIINDIDPSNPPCPVDYIEPTALRMDPDKAVNAKIANLCETPDPKPVNERTKKILADFYKSDEYKIEQAQLRDPEPDYAESLISVLADEAIDREEQIKAECREARVRNDMLTMMEGIIIKQNDLIISEPPKPLPVKQRTIFDEAHRVLWNLESMAKRSQIDTKYIHMDIGGFNISTISAECGDAEANVSINKKVNLTAGTAD